MKLNALTSVHKLNLIATCYLQKYLTNRFLLLNQIVAVTVLDIEYHQTHTT